MRSRLAVLFIALLLGIAAAVLTGRYLNSLERGVAAKDEPVEVFVAQDTLTRGAAAEGLIAERLIVRQRVPRRYVAQGAVSAASSIEGKVLAEDVSKGEQITAARFKFPSDAGLAYSIPPDHVAVAIANDPVKGVAGLVKPNDFVMVVATLDPGPDGTGLTKVILDRVRVLAVGRSVGAEASESGGGGGVIGGASGGGEEQAAQNGATITLAVSPSDLEKLIFAEEKGSVRLALLAPKGSEVAATSGRTLRTVVKE